MRLREEFSGIPSSAPGVPSRCWQNCSKAVDFSLLPQARGSHKDQLGFPIEEPELVGDKQVARTIQGSEDPVGMDSHHETENSLLLLASAIV